MNTHQQTLNALRRISGALWIEDQLRTASKPTPSDCGSPDGQPYMIHLLQYSPLVGQTEED